jgi:soluble cytochrome b562
VKPKDKLLTFEQAKELKWFCKNVAETRQEFYDRLESIEKFRNKLDRLQQTADMILKWCEENNIKTVHES